MIYNDVETIQLFFWLFDVILVENPWTYWRILLYFKIMETILMFACILGSVCKKLVLLRHQNSLIRWSNPSVVLVPMVKMK